MGEKRCDEIKFSQMLKNQQMKRGFSIENCRFKLLMAHFLAAIQK